MEDFIELQFITDKDYKLVADKQSMQIISQFDAENRFNAEITAIEEVKTYLSKYDVEKVFSTQGKARNPLIVQCVVDIALYTMSSWLPSNMGQNETRLIRYENRLKWLKDVATNKIQIDLPLLENNSTGVSNSGFYFSSNPKKNNEW